MTITREEAVEELGQLQTWVGEFQKMQQNYDQVVLRANYLTGLIAGLDAGSEPDPEPTPTPKRAKRATKASSS